MKYDLTIEMPDGTTTTINNCTADQAPVPTCSNLFISYKN